MSKLSPLSGKKIILAITGSIAAYKTPGLARLFIKAGAEVKVVMTPAASQFVSPLSLSTVSRNPVWNEVHDGHSWNNHVSLGRWADLMLVAPCTANTLARLTHGICGNMVEAVYLSAPCPVFLAPAMDEDMWQHPATKENVRLLQGRGHYFIPVGHGELASGLIGPGRMAEPEEIAAALSRYFSGGNGFPLKGVQALVTAGPTYEAIDPVRFIGNFSSGKMGIAFAEQLAHLGASVKLVLGPTHLRAGHPAIETIPVRSSEEMYQACIQNFPVAGLTIMAAAVADYTPELTAAEKIKKEESTLSLNLVKTKDILAALGKMKQPEQLLIGFALETENELANARQKLERKNADFILLNSLRDEGAGFGTDTNKITLIDREGGIKAFPLQDKKDIATAIIHHIIPYLHVKNTV